MTITIENSIWINRKPADVFAFITNPDTIAKFLPGCISASRVGDGEVGVGSQMDVELAVMGKRQQIRSEFTRYEPGVALGSKNVQGMKSDLLTTLHEENGGTRVERVLNVSPGNFFETLASPLIKRTAQRNADTEFANMKDLLEQ